jgi:LemA protein
MPVLLAALVALALVAACSAGAWHGLIAARNSAEATWDAIDAHLTRRHRLVPALIAVVGRVVPGEHAVLDRLDAARAATIVARTPFEQADAERRLVGALIGTAELVAAHPALGGDAEFVEVQAQLADVDEGLMAARRIYNADVRLYLQRRRRFPAFLLSRAGGFPERPYFELDHTRERPVALRLVG